ncbi:hypothetical protein [Desulfurobacterium sp.]
MPKPTFEEFRKAYFKAESELIDLLLNQLQACEPCKVIDYAYCLKRCRVLKETLSKAREHSDFFWIAKKIVYQILQFVKAETFCKANGIEIDYSTEFSVPKLEELPPEDEPVIEKLHKLFRTKCKTCRLPIGKSCFECEEAVILRRELKTQIGRRIFDFFLTLNADIKRESRDPEVLYFYQRIYEPPVKVNWFPKDPWGFFFYKILDKKRH